MYFICVYLQQGHICNYGESRVMRFERSFYASIFFCSIENMKSISFKNKECDILLHSRMGS